MKRAGFIIIAMLLPLLVGAKARPPRTPPIPAVTGASAEWTDETFAADVYPSQRLAAERLGVQWAEMAAVSPERITEVRIYAAGMPATVSQVVRDAIRNRLPDAACRIVEQEAEATAEAGAKPDAVELRVRLEEISSVPSTSDKRRSLRLETSNRTALSASTAYIDKPWADESRAGNDRELQTDHLIARSIRPAATAAEAHQQAVANAAARLMQRIQASVLERRLAYASVDERWLTEKISREIQQGRLIQDRFVQKFDRPYGAIYREAVLLRVTGDDLNRLVREAQASMHVRQEASRNGVLSIGGLVLVVYLLYLLLNAVTKGYFRWSLRATAVLLALIGVLVLVMLA